MARIDLHNFFKFYDEKNPKYPKIVFEKVLTRFETSFLLCLMSELPCVFNYYKF